MGSKLVANSFNPFRFFIMTQRNCTVFPNDPDLCDIIVAVRQAMGSLSLIGCLFIIVVIWLFKKNQIFTWRLILYLSIAACLNSITFLMPGFLSEGPLCNFQAWWLTFFIWAVVLWACCITFNLYQNAIRTMRTEKYERIYHFISWGVALVASCIPFIGNHYGPADMWCWIHGKSSRAQVMRFYIPLWCMIAYMLLTYFVIVWKLRRMVDRYGGTYSPELERQREFLRKDVKLLRAYPLVYMVLSIFPSVNRIQNAFDDKKIFGLLLMQTISSPLFGVVSALVFTFDKETRKLLTWSSFKNAIYQRMHARPGIVSEYPIIQTTGSVLSRVTSDGITNFSTSADVAITVNQNCDDVSKQTTPGDTGIV
ncbi:G-protein coupled receptor 1-like isoform X2 [Xenia sp. Carnegie-2017]|uniref:G-protein coupled receptor 1-like isoform X2 n=1 Tax=Xenia sp. Carnegie-2017 TaxID=2897299 RepID=UPI001F049F5E|nr:G-protein coupled receptor 1-like isoform X2 [Xenia sp. Carnegie-2017]